MTAQGHSVTSSDFESGRPLVLRGGTVLTMDADKTVLTGADVLVVESHVEAVGQDLDVPDGTVEIDARDGIVMPGMIDTHRHMWQSAMRGYGADWTLTQYFVWYYRQHGKAFRPEDIHAGNVLSAIEALDAGVTTSVDWSHGLQTVDHADAAVDALESVSGRFVLAYGNIQAGPWEWSAKPEFRDFVSRRFTGSDMLGFQMAFDVTGDPAFPEKAAFEVARELNAPVTTHAGVWGATNDDGIRLMYENGFMEDRTIYVHAATLTADSYNRIAATGGVLMGLAFLVLAVQPTWWPAPAAVLAIGFGFYMLHNTLQTVATQMAPEARGTSVALFASVYFIGQTVGVVLAAPVMDRAGAPPLFVAVAVLLPLVAWWFTRRLRRRGGD